MQSIQTLIFGGIRPAVTPRNLEPHMAVKAHNTRLRDGSLRAITEPKLLRTEPYTIEGIYHFRDTGECCGRILTWDHCVSVIEPVDPGCAGFNGIVVFHEDQCKTPPQRYFNCEDKFYPLIVPQPQAPPSAVRTAAGSVPLDAQNMGETSHRGPDARAYVYTWVDRFGVESPPSPPSVTHFAYDDETWTVTGFDPPPANAVCIRIYRPGGVLEDGKKPANPMDTTFQLVREVEVGPGTAWSGTFVDSYRFIDMTYGTLMTEEDCPPPCMTQVVMTEQGYAVGFKDNEIYVSERSEPHNWPERYRVTIPEKIVAICAYFDHVLIGTTGRPYRMNVSFARVGNEASATVDPVPFTDILPCISKKAFMSTPFGAIYVSYESLVLIAPQGQATQITRKRIDEQDWYRDFAPNIGAFHDGRVHFARSPVGRATVMDVPDMSVGRELDIGDLYTIDWHPRATHIGRRSQLLYSEGANLYEWEAGQDVLTYVWESKVFRLAGEVGFGAMKIVGAYGPPITLELYADNRLYHTRQVRSSRPFRLPMRGRALEWHYRLTGTTQVYEVHIATSVRDLTQERRGA